MTERLSTAQHHLYVESVYTKQKQAHRYKTSGYGGEWEGMGAHQGHGIKRHKLYKIDTEGSGRDGGRIRVMGLRDASYIK